MNLGRRLASRGLHGISRLGMVILKLRKKTPIQHSNSLILNDEVQLTNLICFLEPKKISLKLTNSTSKMEPVGGQRPKAYFQIIKVFLVGG